MHPSSSTTVSGPMTEPMQTKTKWSKLTYDQRMEILVHTLQVLKRAICGYEKTINDLRRHQHDPKNGQPYTTKEIDGGYYGQDVPTRGPLPIEHLPIDNYDFDELKII